MTLSTATPTYNQTPSKEKREMTEVGKALEEAQEQAIEESQVYVQDYVEEATGRTMTVT